MKPILLTAAGNPENQDRGLVLDLDSRLVLCVTDGAGGRSGGAEAATMAVDFIRKQAATLENESSCMEALSRLDAAIEDDPLAGETTCALALVEPNGICGASVGDSGVWLILENGEHVNLTQSQQRKPFIGSSMAIPVPFRHPFSSGWLLLATDGLLKYTSPERIVESCRQDSAETAASKLIELVRYPSGALPDDVTVILVKLSL